MFKAGTVLRCPTRRHWDITNMACIPSKRHRRRDQTLLDPFRIFQIRLRFRTLTVLKCATAQRRDMT